MIKNNKEERKLGMKWFDLIVEVKEVKGFCPVYTKGDKITIREGYRVDLKESNALCTHSLCSMIPWIVSISGGTEPEKLGLAKKGCSAAYVQCLDPGEPYTDGGTVIFEIKRLKPPHQP